MQKLDIKQFLQTSQLTDGNIAYVESLYDQYLKNPKEIDPSWQKYFDQLKETSKQATDVPLSDVRAEFLSLAKTNGHAIPRITAQDEVSLAQVKQAQVMQLINAYRWYGHFQAELDPLQMAKKLDVPDLDPAFHGLHPADYELSFAFTKDDYLGLHGKHLTEILRILRQTYCSSIGIEYMHIGDSAEVHWLQQRFESAHGKPTFSSEKKISILHKLISGEGLERYLGSKYVGQKRFSGEGAVSMIPMLDELVARAGAQGVQELIMGMAHRGRLNVLVNILGKDPKKLFAEFEGAHDKDKGSGDVKYHMGFSSDVKTSGGVLHLAMAFNPSHLEIIDPVVVGSTRARQDRRRDTDKTQVISLLIHGDAAFCGQGVVMETFALSQLRGFGVGGTIHIVVNNQLGFTTSKPEDMRSSFYCTDIAKMVDAPIFHVNGDDPEACVFVMQLAHDYRMQFKKDVVIDMVCYRRHGHNEADEPAITQPLMYNKIRNLPRTNEIYAEKLIAEKLVTTKEIDETFEAYRKRLDEGKTLVNLVPKQDRSPYLADWSKYKDQKWTATADTTYSIEKLTEIAKKISRVPQGFVLQPQVAREFEMREKMAMGEAELNWGFAEALAFATLIKNGYPVRLCGQDSGRGTFSHRHAVLHDQQTGECYVPLQNLAMDQANFTVIDSVLSEEGVMGFEYGYATTDPETLVIWEAQFGDFFNGAQVVIDQFISSGEQKWGRLCGLTLFLPHGFEGQGPEHSSARLERFLQLSAQKNIQVCIPTTTAQFFHMIRRQILRPYRKPLVVLTPKSLLRFKPSFSSLAECATGKFQPVLDEVEAIKPEAVKRVILCTGKVYYDLLKYRQDQKINDVAIIRVEQLYPYPKQTIIDTIAKYEKAKIIIWCQEEPRNQGAWYFMAYRLMACIKPDQILKYAGRSASASPATGYTAFHTEQQKLLVKEAFEKS